MQDKKEGIKPYADTEINSEGRKNDGKGIEHRRANIEELIKTLRRGMVETGSLLCLGCGNEHNCSTHGCAIMRQAADVLEELTGHKELSKLWLENTRRAKELDAERHRQSIMDKETETALTFAATIIMQQVCDNPKLSRRQRGKMRKWAGILKDLADKKEENT